VGEVVAVGLAEEVGVGVGAVEMCKVKEPLKEL
jgi:hypothetical protein